MTRRRKSTSKTNGSARKAHVTEPNTIVGRILANPQTRQAIMEASAREGQPLTRQAISDWRKLKRGVPSSRVMMVSRVLRIPPHEIRPDVFPPPRRQASR